MTAAQATLASAALQAGAPMISAYAKGKQAEEEQKELDENSKYQLDLKGIYGDSLRSAGGVETDENGNTVYRDGQGAPVQQVANVDQKPQSYYNSADDSWSPVQRVANRQARERNTDRHAKNTDKKVTV